MLDNVSLSVLGVIHRQSPFIKFGCVAVKRITFSRHMFISLFILYVH